MPLTQFPDLQLIFAQFLQVHDAARLAVASKSSLRALEEANEFLSSTIYKGVDLCCWRLKGASFQQMRECMQPLRLVNVSSCSCCAATFTSPTPVALDTTTSLFVRFWIGASRAQKGCPCVGLVDADEVKVALLEDKSRPASPHGKFGISCNPFSGKVYASQTSRDPKNMLGDLPEKEPNSPKTWSADVIGWRSWEDQTLCCHGSSIGIGMLISNGTLEFIRQGQDGWECSGMIQDHLPPKILCCAFMNGFVGDATVSTEEVSHQCPCCAKEEECSVKGRLSSWEAWPQAS